MNDPFKQMLNMQAAMLQGWTKAAQQVLLYWEHMADLQEKLVHTPADKQRNHVEIASGPSLTDKYGKRSHDIDPERDV
jgi:hypothetical protein